MPGATRRIPAGSICHSQAIAPTPPYQTGPRNRLYRSVGPPPPPVGRPDPAPDAALRRGRHRTRWRALGRVGGPPPPATGVPYAPAPSARTGGVEAPGEGHLQPGRRSEGRPGTQGHPYRSQRLRRTRALAPVAAVPPCNQPPPPAVPTGRCVVCVCCCCCWNQLHVP